MTSHDLQIRLRALGNSADAAFLAGFFKTGPGQYGEGDVLIGVRVPVIRKVAGSSRTCRCGRPNGSCTLGFTRNGWRPW